MKSKSADKIKMPSIDELLGVSGEESATDIEISRIHSFANHPFKVLDDDKMDDLVESIKQNGVLTPVLVRPDKNNSYEMISGHRRMHAAIKAGLETIPAIVRDMEDDEAIVIMVDANIQREEYSAHPRTGRRTRVIPHLRNHCTPQAQRQVYGTCTDGGHVPLVRFADLGKLQRYTEVFLLKNKT